MGVVYKARQVGLKRTVALKMILAGAHAGAEELARFRWKRKPSHAYNIPTSSLSTRQANFPAARTSRSSSWKAAAWRPNSTASPGGLVLPGSLSPRWRRPSMRPTSAISFTAT
jgi:hypothetical protein